VSESERSSEAGCRSQARAPSAQRGTGRPAEDYLRTFIRDIPDFPKPGIVFKDITPLLLDPAALDAAVDGLATAVRPLRVDYVIAAEARGFILGAALARELGAGFVPARKPGKLPHETVSAEYTLEYGLDALEVHADALAGGARVLIHDDLLATGGTAGAVCDLVESLGAEIAACAFLVELSFLGGRARLAPHQVHALIDYSA
jgi:adenine phosphoribosyltransferase